MFGFVLIFPSGGSKKMVKARLLASLQPPSPPLWPLGFDYCVRGLLVEKFARTVSLIFVLTVELLMSFWFVYKNVPSFSALVL